MTVTGTATLPSFLSFRVAVTTTSFNSLVNTESWVLRWAMEGSQDEVRMNPEIIIFFNAIPFEGKIVHSLCENYHGIVMMVEHQILLQMHDNGGAMIKSKNDQHHFLFWVNW
jgi:hypothetical protein